MEGQEKFTEQDEFFEEILNKALSGKHANFEFIKCWQEYLVARSYISGCKTIINSFNSLYLKVQRAYLKQIETASQDFNLLITMKQFETCRDYFKDEIAIAKDMISEYRAYVFSGHLLDTFLFNAYRREEDLVDYRKLPWKWF